MDDLNVNFTGDLQKVSIDSKDTLVLTTDRVLSHEQRTNINHLLDKSFPNNKTLIIDGGLKFSIATE